LPKAVTKSTGVSGACFCTQSNTSSPSVSIIRMSLTTASNSSGSCANRAMASAPSEKALTWCPSSARMCSISAREAASSSTTTMRAGSVMRPPRESGR
jgi:hypothetical protein